MKKTTKTNLIIIISVIFLILLYSYIDHTIEKKSKANKYEQKVATINENKKKQDINQPDIKKREPEAFTPYEKYKKIAENNKEIGIWRVYMSGFKNEYSYVYEIYEKEGNYYYGVFSTIGEELKFLFKPYKVEELYRKKVSNGLYLYFVNGSKTNEYYKIDSKGNMTLHDKNGPLRSVGVFASKIKFNQ